MKQLMQTAAAVLLLTTVFVSCKKDDKDETPAPQENKQVKFAESATLGKYLTDKDGRTLYFFANDASGQSNCTGGCEAIWPVFFVDNLTQEQLADGLPLGGFGTITTASGKKQLTYKGWPLYYFAPSTGGVNTKEAPGQTGGEGIGGTWFVAKQDYSIMLANAQLVGNDGKNYTNTYTEGAGKTSYFTNDRGVTLYTFSKDKLNTNTFTKNDFSNNPIWPIYETDKIIVPSTLDKSLFGSITVFGKKQLTYKGWPLYFFGQDNTTRGFTKGVSVPTPGIWPVPVKDIAASLP
jgi:predicted lipoprotein with Yx(FWY)xxD motif